MELHKRHPLLRPGEVLCEGLGDVGLPGTRRPLENDLLLVLKQGVDPLQKVDGKVQVVGQGSEVSLFDPA